MRYADAVQMAHLNDAITLALYECDITQRELAEHLGVTQATISRWMTGALVPRAHKVNIIIGQCEDIWKQQN